MRQIYAIVTTSVETGKSTLLSSSSGGVAVFPSAESARAAAIELFGKGNSNVAVRVARIGVVLQGVA